MTITFITGLIGVLLTVIGAAWPSPTQSSTPYCTKNYLFTVGNSVLFTYAILQYLQSGSIFFVILECIVLVATVLMYITITDLAKTYILTVCGIGCIVWSLVIIESVFTIVFILGISILSLGYSFTVHTKRREVAFVIGSVLITIFSVAQGNWIFVVLNSFFAVFSGWHWSKSCK